MESKAEKANTQLPLLILQKTLGSGTDGSVYWATEKNGQRSIALKVFQLCRSAGVQNERKAHARLQSGATNPFILKTWNMLCDGRSLQIHPRIRRENTPLESLGPDTVILPMELAQSDLLRQLAVAQSFDEETCRKCFKEILLGLKFAHDRQVGHCDIKMENILIGMDGHIKISDWGSSITGSENRHSNQMLTKSIRGTKMYAAPEVMQQREIAEDKSLGKYEWDAYKGDVWCAAIILFIMSSGKAPFHTASLEDDWFRTFLHITGQEAKLASMFYRMQEAYDISPTPVEETVQDIQERAQEKIQSGRYFKWPETRSEALTDLLESMLRVDPQERISVQEALEHPWISSQFSPQQNKKTCKKENIEAYGSCSSETLEGSSPESVNGDSVCAR
eukprot:gb/GECG01015558.1/.p1 GENE.gb/GECG01015558.1/~~gb/GECG01015558.1/.p1  ORF type:complete len:392 (+),score=51.36 gb/GECG01015558.1/:1-1176(+)